MNVVVLLGHVRRKPAPKRYLCPVCARSSQYGGPCSGTCRGRATAAQRIPFLNGATTQWDPTP